MVDLDRIGKIVEGCAGGLGFDLVRVKMMPSEAGDGGEALQIMAEDPKTGQLVIEQCASLSRAVSAAFDEVENTGEVLIDYAYHLEVSSPGIDRPLTRLKDFSQWAGHEVKISLSEKLDNIRNIRGELLGLEGDKIVVADSKAGRLAISHETIHAARLVLTDALIAASKPLDTSGVDELLEDEEEA